MLDLITKFDEEEAKIYYESDNHINCDKEIERLNIELQDTKEHLGEYLYEQEEENKRLNNIIQEVREYIEKHIEDTKHLNNVYSDKTMLDKVLEILDKGE